MAKIKRDPKRREAIQKFIELSRTIKKYLLFDSKHHSSYNIPFKILEILYKKKCTILYILKF